jgi:hypothetical protein
MTDMSIQQSLSRSAALRAGLRRKELFFSFFHMGLVADDYGSRWS